MSEPLATKEPRKTSASLQKACRTLHRWLGLSIGLVLVLIGLTGSLNVFYREIDAALNTALYSPDPERRAQGVSIGAEAALAAAAAADPAPATAVSIPDAIWPVWVVNHTHPDGHVWQTMVDPGSGRVLGRRDSTWAFAFAVYRLHYTLLLKPFWGEEFVGIVGIGLLIAAVTGVVAWWPAFGRIVRSLFPRRGTSGQRFWIDLHRSLGVWIALILTVIATTGIGIIYPSLVRPVIGLMSATTDALKPTPLAPGAPRANADLVLARAAQARPGDIATILNPPGARGPLWRVLMRPAGSDPAVRGISQLWFEPATGTLLADRSWDAMTNGDRYIALQLWLHNGSIAGLPGRVLTLAMGLSLAVMFATGFGVWFDRRRRKRNARAT